MPLLLLLLVLSSTPTTEECPVQMKVGSLIFGDVQEGRIPESISSEVTLYRTSQCGVLLTCQVSYWCEYERPLPCLARDWWEAHGSAPLCYMDLNRPEGFRRRSTR